MTKNQFMMLAVRVPLALADSAVQFGPNFNGNKHAALRKQAALQK